MRLGTARLQDVPGGRFLNSRRLPGAQLGRPDWYYHWHRLPRPEFSGDWLILSRLAIWAVFARVPGPLLVGILCRLNTACGCRAAECLWGCLWGCLLGCLLGCLATVLDSSCALLPRGCCLPLSLRLPVLPVCSYFMWHRAVWLGQSSVCA